MKKFIITEEEKNRILGMHQDYGYNSLNEINDNAGNMSPAQVKQVNQAPEAAPAPAPAPQNDLYTKKFSCIGYEPKDGDTVGHYNPANMDFLRLFFKDSIYVYWENKTIIKYVRNGDVAGAEVKKGTWKCKSDNSNVDVVWVNNTPTKPALKASGQSTPNTTESSIGVIYQYEYPKDTKYRYGVKDKKWFGKNLANGKEFDLSTFTTTIANLNGQFPNAMTQQETPVDTTTTTAAPATAATTTTTTAAPATATAATPAAK